jgi:penicillin-binding protein 2
MKPLSLPPSQALAIRIRKMVVCVGIGFLVLLLRLWYLQILEGGYYFTLSTNNHLRLRPVEAPRGVILDRHGEILV